MSRIKRVCAVGALTVVLHHSLYFCEAAEQSELGPPWTFQRPLNVCFDSQLAFSSRCNGAPQASLEEAHEPSGSVPKNGWCDDGVDFCGYDVDVWSVLAKRLGLVEGIDYNRVCMGEKGFEHIIDDMAGSPQGFNICDVSGSVITATTERASWGIQFSRPIYQGALSILIYAPLKPRGIWAFMQPLDHSVWLALGSTMVLTPFFVFFFEFLFSGRCVYADKRGRVNLFHGMKEALWGSVSHMLSINVFQLHSWPARIVALSYAFTVLIVTSTYTANLAAFLTVDSLDTSINSVRDLYGESIASYPVYEERLQRKHRLNANIRDGWDHDAMIDKLKKGVYTAVIADNVVLDPLANADQDCMLHVLPDTIEPFDLVIGFRKGFQDVAFVQALDAKLLQLQEEGTLADIQAAQEHQDEVCIAPTEYTDTNQVELKSLGGLWVILGVATIAAILAGCAQYWYKRRHPQRHQLMTARIAHFSRALSAPFTALLRPTCSKPDTRSAASSVHERSSDCAHAAHAGRQSTSGCCQEACNVQGSGVVMQDRAAPAVTLEPSGVATYKRQRAEPRKPRELLDDEGAQGAVAQELQQLMAMTRSIDRLINDFIVAQSGAQSCLT